MNKTVFFSVGEPSGDQHTARLISALHTQATAAGTLGVSADSIKLRGFGGPAMKAAGCKLDLDLTQHAVVGLLEVLPKIREFFRFADQAEAIFEQGGIDAVLLVDFPGFNWHVARRARKHGIPVYYYCPPQLWAWGGWRVRKMKRLIDHVLAVLPIEEEYFSRHGIPTTYVGHPFFDAVAQTQLDPRVMSKLVSTPEAPLVAVLPGSRGHEVRRNWPLMLAAIRRLNQKHPHAKFAIACYRDSQCQWCRHQLSESDASLPIEFYVGRTSEIIQAARCSMMVSGSVSLEMMARRTPAAVIYRVGRFLYAFGKCVIGVDSMTLPNLMHHEKVFPEMVSVGDPSAAIEFLADSVDAMIADEFYYQKKLRLLDELCERYAQPGATQRAAQWLCSRLGIARESMPARRAA
ncbi:lipid-A-disaccharide synthase [Stieleria varia]|uniref:Lipid-A-disaccharide synthase n=1 Tax=Stieleria varia TaxID=2528005 RepID=A0A5C5ZZ15_9BACT|nr:lipid-A-disaccharide synthase [Stieleria varia]TWT92406.1 Glycosyl transferase [Stieleria varia]